MILASKKPKQIFTLFEIFYNRGLGVQKFNYKITLFLHDPKQKLPNRQTAPMLIQHSENNSLKLIIEYCKTEKKIYSYFYVNI